MNKLLLTALSVLFTVASLFAQDDSTKAKMDFYVSAGLSVSNTHNSSFKQNSYPSVEVGMMKNNFSFGAVFGRSNLNDFGHDDISNYWYEGKAAIWFPIGKFNGYGLLGIGNYIASTTIFIEYGVGFAYNFNKFGVFSQVSNWDGTWYVTPGVSYTF